MGLYPKRVTAAQGTQAPFTHIFDGSAQVACSSTAPLQLLSTPSQTSGAGTQPPLFWHKPLTQTCIGFGHVAPSSMALSQSLSWPSQTSGEGMQPPHDPLMQTWVGS